MHSIMVKTFANCLLAGSEPRCHCVKNLTHIGLFREEKKILCPLFVAFKYADKTAPPPPPPPPLSLEYF